ncbi:RNA polymerase sigma factor [Danxiaibacter flavus]|uniref:RNA polymerase sigma factor n=1 Tax=Danxiaibacter flavus TaxID=3049108 RepID=A0ABV3ZJ92_9BACT|nr:RNA polymerase sigma factor [Chitinophagaceae bacterium DXS]
MNHEEMSETTTTSDGELITRILQGEKDLYAFIVRRYNQRLFKVGISILNDDTEVEDVMQVTYINAYENLGKFGFKASFSTWLTRILINECLLRLKKRGSTITMNDDNMEREWQYRLAGETQTPATKVLNSELKTILEEAIRKLPEIYRTVFVMREIENMNVAETQACLSISEVNVKVRLNRAKALLRDLLSNYYRKEDIFNFHLSRCDRMVDKVMSQIK